MIVDSCFVVDLLAGDDAAEAKLDELVAERELLAISTLSVVEIERGLERDAPRLRDTFDSVIDGLEVVPFELDAARVAGRIHRQLDGEGRAIGALDGMIAATAMTRDGRVLTRNVGEFRRVDGVRPVPY